MGVGHVALALAATKAVPRMNVGLLVFAACFADVLLGIFTSFGMEHFRVPADYSKGHYLMFTFPYSHSLAALMMWGAALGIGISLMYSSERSRVMVAVSLLVVSHYVLDGIVHVGGLPLLGEQSPKLGLGLWKWMPVELGVETVMWLAGIVVFWGVAAGTRSSRYAVALVTFVVLTMTLAAPWQQRAPNPGRAALEWICLPITLSALLFAVDRKRVQRAAPLA